MTESMDTRTYGPAMRGSTSGGAKTALGELAFDYLHVLKTPHHGSTSSVSASNINSPQQERTVGPNAQSLRQSSDALDIASPVIDATSAVPPNPSVPLVITHRWYGVVAELHEEYFTAVLRTEDDPDVELVADLPLESVDPDDIELVEEGSAFYLNVGHTLAGRGRRSQVSALRFRRLPSWRGDELDYLIARAGKRRTLLGLDGTPRSSDA